MKPSPPTDIAFVAPGMPARIKVTAYDHTLHGWIPGAVEHVSADAIVNEKGEAFFQVRVRPERVHLGAPERPLPILPGMMATVDVVTGNRTILEYLLKPVLKARDRALTER
jgi:adhesin transport system membrane fusion protein